MKLQYDFWEFDNLYSCLHLLFIQPEECPLEDNYVDTISHRVNNFVNKIKDFLPSFDGDMKLKQEKKVDKLKFKPLVEAEKSKLVKAESIEKLDKQDKTNKSANEHASKHIEEESEDDDDMDESEKKLIKEVKNKQRKHNSALSANSTFTRKLNENNRINEENLSTKNSTFINSTEVSKNLTIPKIITNQNGCILALDRFGNLYYIDKETLHEDNTKYLNQLNNKEKKSKSIKSSNWELIRSNVKDFEMNSNLIIILDFSNRLYYQNHICENASCEVKSQFNWIIFSLSSRIIKIGLSNYNCLWLLDDKDDVI